MGSQVSWHKPTYTALTARFGQASAACKSSRNMWNSRLPIRVKLRIFQSVIVSTFINSLDLLTMLPKRLRRLNSFYFRLLRRVVGVKAAFSRVAKIRVWEQAGRPTTPAQIILQQQTKLLSECLATPPNDPFHHVVFISALGDRIECNKIIIPGKATSLIITHVRLLTATHQSLVSTPPPDHKPNEPPTTLT